MSEQGQHVPAVMREARSRSPVSGRPWPAVGDGHFCVARDFCAVRTAEITRCVP